MESTMNRKMDQVHTNLLRGWNEFLIKEFSADPDIETVEDCIAFLKEMNDYVLTGKEEIKK